MVKNLLANTECTSSIPVPGRSHMPGSNKSRVQQLPRLQAATAKARVPRARAPQREKPHSEKPENRDEE